jgi:predicted nucleotidyltransferase
VDILVELGKPMGYAFFGIQDEMEAVLKRKVDLLTYKSVDPLLKNYILKDKKMIYGQRL